MTTVSPSRGRATLYLVVAGLLWVVVFALVLRLVLGGGISTLSYQVYQAAGLHWLRAQPLYELRTIENFQYFPQSAMLMAPFAALGSPAGAVVWRALWWLIYAVGIYRLLARLVGPGEPRALAFLLASLLGVGQAVSALKNGQANLAVAGLIMHAAAELIDRRYLRATVVLALGVALKPLMAVPLLLAAALHRPMRWRLVIALAVVALLPFIWRDHNYVTAQYHACFAKLRLAARPGPLYEDLRGLLARAGWLIPHTLYLVVRLIAGLATLALCWSARRRLTRPHAGVITAAAAASYLMLFNPRTQSTSYTIVACLAAVLAATHLIERRWLPAAALAVILAAWLLNYHQAPFIQFWFKPALCIAFVATLVHAVLRAPAGWQLAAPKMTTGAPFPGRPPV